MVKYERNGERGREALVVRNCSINIWDGSELELAWSKIGSSYFENNFPISLLSGISNTSICKMRDVLHWVSFWYFPWHPLLRQVIFEYILHSIYFLLLPTSFIYIKNFFIKAFKIKEVFKNKYLHITYNYFIIL